MLAQSFYAGAATSNITPALGVSLNGSMRDRTATHIHDELHARCLVLDDGQMRIGMVVCDSCMMPAHLLDRAKHMAHESTDLPLDRILISRDAHAYCADHGRCVSKRTGPGIHRVSRTANRRWAPSGNEQPGACQGRLGHGRRRLASIQPPLANERWRDPPDPFGASMDRVRMNPPRGSADLLEPAGPIDPEICLLAVTAHDGRPHRRVGELLAALRGRSRRRTLFRRLLRPVRESNVRASRRRATRSSIRGNHVERHQRQHQQHRFPPRRRAAGALRPKCAESLMLWRRPHIEPIRIFNSTIMSHSTCGRCVSRSVGASPAPMKSRRPSIFSVRPRPGNSRVPRRSTPERRCSWVDLPATVETSVQALRIGDLGIAAIPCEVFVETGLEIKAASSLKPSFTIELANDYCGYLPTAEQHELGGYETWRARSSFLEVGAESKVRQAVLASFAKLV